MPSSRSLEKGMLYGSAQTRSSELDRGALPMSATDAAATHIAPVSFTRVKCMVLPVDPAEDDGSARDTTPGAGARSLRHRVTTVLRAAPASRQAEHHQRAACVAHVGVIAERADRPECGGRSEEHTSELQSRLHLVCRLLLEKKN